MRRMVFYPVLPSSRCGMLFYSALAETLLAFGGIDFAARLRWLLYLLDPGAVASGASNFGQSLTRIFHNDQL
jgi:hypothetical protein